MLLTDVSCANNPLSDNMTLESVNFGEKRSQSDAESQMQDNDDLESEDGDPEARLFGEISWDVRNPGGGLR